MVFNDLAIDICEQLVAYEEVAHSLDHWAEFPYIHGCANKKDRHPIKQLEINIDKSGDEHTKAAVVYSNGLKPLLSD